MEHDHEVLKVYPYHSLAVKIIFLPLGYTLKYKYKSYAFARSTHTCILPYEKVCNYHLISRQGCFREKNLSNNTVLQMDCKSTISKL